MQPKLDYPDQFCLLIVDGHSSHESLNTITYCQEHKIILLVLPSHCMHALQPLDVVLFSPLKQSWAATVAEHEFNGKSITKDNFIKVYSNAHLHAFTKANILVAFWKSGIHPFNPLVITKEKMATSTMDSVNVAEAMPIQLTSPVKKVMQLFHDECEWHWSEWLSNSPSHSPLPLLDGIPPMQPPSVAPSTPCHLSRHQVQSPNEDTELLAQSPTKIIQECTSDTPMAILLTLT